MRANILTETASVAREWKRPRAGAWRPISPDGARAGRRAAGRPERRRNARSGQHTDANTVRRFRAPDFGGCDEGALWVVRFPLALQSISKRSFAVIRWVMGLTDFFLVVLCRGLCFPVITHPAIFVEYVVTFEALP